MTAPMVLWFALAVIFGVGLLIWLAFVLVFIQQWRGRGRWRKSVQDMQERRKHAGGAGAARASRYDPKVFRGNR